jgi:hypothetical protein
MAVILSRGATTLMMITLDLYDLKSTLTGFRCRVSAHGLTYKSHRFANIHQANIERFESDFFITGFHGGATLCGLELLSPVMLACGFVFRANQPA